jgi:hypothetical protein
MSRAGGSAASARDINQCPDCKNKTQLIYDHARVKKFQNFSFLG